MATVAKWIDEISATIPNVPMDRMLYQVKRTINEFCEESTAWREMIYDLDVTTGERDIEIPVDAIATAGGNEGDCGYTVIGILRVYRDNNQLTPYSHVPWETSTSLPYGYTAKPGNPYKISLATIPTADLTDQIDVWVYGMPQTIAIDTVMPWRMTSETEWYEAIYHGTIGRLLSMSTMPWGDPATASYHLKKFRNRCILHRSEANRGYTTNAQNWVYPSFGR